MLRVPVVPVSGGTCLAEPEPEQAGHQVGNGLLERRPRPVRPVDAQRGLPVQGAPDQRGKAARVGGVGGAPGLLAEGAASVTDPDRRG